LFWCGTCSPPRRYEKVKRLNSWTIPVAAISTLPAPVIVTIGIPDEQVEPLLKSTDWNISDNFCVFGVDFERAIRESFPEYAEIKKEKRSELGTA
jgi:hypothetical protein